MNHYRIALNFEDGVTRFVDCGANEKVLDAAFRNRINLPMDCSDGVCGTCKTAVLEGSVEMNHNGGIRQRDQPRLHGAGDQGRPTDADVALRHRVVDRRPQIGPRIAAIGVGIARRFFQDLSRHLVGQMIDHALQQGQLRREVVQQSALAEGQARHHGVQLQPGRPLLGSGLDGHVDDLGAGGFRRAAAGLGVHSALLPSSWYVFKRWPDRPPRSIGTPLLPFLSIASSSWPLAPLSSPSRTSVSRTVSVRCSTASISRLSRASMSNCCWTSSTSLGFSG